MNVLRSILALTLLFSAHSFSQAREEQCLKSKKHVCAVPFHALYSRAERYAHAVISVKGFLQREHDSFVLYPDETSMQYLVRESALEVQGLDAEGIEASEVLVHRFVEVVGVLNASTDPRYWSGLRVVRSPQEVPIAITGVIEAAPPRPTEKGL